jgi:hypothetical protein
VPSQRPAFEATIDAQDREDQKTESVRVTITCYTDPANPYVAGIVRVYEPDAEHLVAILHQQIGPTIGPPDDLTTLPTHLN